MEPSAERLAGSTPEQPDLLTFGPPSPHWSHRRWRVILPVLLVALVLTAGAPLTRRWLGAVSPTFTRDEVAQVYGALPAAPSGRYRWAPGTVTVEDGGRLPVPRSDRGVCDEVAGINSPPSSRDVATISFGRADSRVDVELSGNLSTYRYDEPSAARGKLQTINRALQQCSVLSLDGDSLRLDEVATGPDIRSRSMTSFRVRLPDGGDGLQVRIVRFGNTITWIFDSSGLAATEDLADVVADQLLEVYSARR